jgi:ferredoxin-NADP reductase
MSPFKTYSARLVRSRFLSEFTKHLEFEVQGQATFGFVPGQWLSVNAAAPDGEEMTRAYSIASPPSRNGSFAFCLNRVEEGFMSNHLCDLPEGSEITFQGPFGDFVLRPPLRDTIFIATGTGIAPFRSMLHALLASRIGPDPIAQSEPDPVTRAHQFWLVFGARTEQDLYYRDEFERLAAEHPNFHFLPTLSRAANNWQGLRGYVQEHIVEIVGTRSDMQAYICGLDKMVKANRELLKSLGWDRRSIRYEKYD